MKVPERKYADIKEGFQNTTIVSAEESKLLPNGDIVPSTNPGYEDIEEVAVILNLEVRQKDIPFTCRLSVWGYTPSETSRGSQWKVSNFYTDTRAIPYKQEHAGDRLVNYYAPDSLKNKSIMVLWYKNDKGYVNPFDVIGKERFVVKSLKSSMELDKIKLSRTSELFNLYPSLRESAPADTDPVIDSPSESTGQHLENAFSTADTLVNNSNELPNQQESAPTGTNPHLSGNGNRGNDPLPF